MAACSIYSWMWTHVLGYPVLLNPSRLAMLIDQVDLAVAVLRQGGWDALA